MTCVIKIDTKTQLLRVFAAGQETHCYPISSAKKGLGEQKGSECTPRGKHRVRVKIGDGAALKTVFVGRRATGELYTPQLAVQYPNRDWILTRILWLGGLEPGFNRYGDVDTTWRYIYIHGCPDELMQGKAASHGCIRMKNHHVMAVFDAIKVGTLVMIS